MKYDKPDGTCFYAVTVEIPDAIYLVKIKIKTDDAEDIERWLNGDDETDDAEGGSNDGESLPDDNIAQYSDGDDDPGDGDWLSPYQIFIKKTDLQRPVFFL